MPLSIPDEPFVGIVGRENTLAVDRRADRLVCHVTRSSLWFTQVIVLLWGGVLSAYVWAIAQKLTTPPPLAILIVAVALALSCWFVFVRNLFGAARLELIYNTGEIWLFRWRSVVPSKRIQKNEISVFEISKQFYTYKTMQTENYLLSVLTLDGKRRPLCASTDEQLIRSLADDFERVTAKKLQAS